jgi:tRNA G18 (ribose-2'-O)-methylase SpoU
MHVQVNEAGLVAYLQQKRAEGYALLGVEQTSGSTLLDAFTFPAKCLLLLGTSRRPQPGCTLACQFRTLPLRV